MLRIYADRSHYSEEHRTALNDILKAHWTDASIADRRATYGCRVDLFMPVEDPAAADLHVLPMKWPHYVNRGEIRRAVAAVELARKYGRELAVLSESDWTSNFPVIGDDIHIFECSAYRSRTRQRIHGMPAFISDPILELGGELDLGSYCDQPRIGFCGQAGTTPPRHAARWVRAQVRIAKWKLGRLAWEPPPIEHTWFRHRVLEAFATSDAVKIDYVLRTQYRAGLSGADGRDASATRREFLQNIVDSDYTVCVRGGGNFSIRFYEALALGRTPIFIDTDCVLPYTRQVNWRELAVWIDARDVNRAADIVAAHHARLDQESLRERRRQARRVWEEWLTPEGFYRHFHEHFVELAAASRKT